jgi:hypothetical protein
MIIINENVLMEVYKITSIWKQVNRYDFGIFCLICNQIDINDDCMVQSSIFIFDVWISLVMEEDCKNVCVTQIHFYEYLIECSRVYKIIVVVNGETLDSD